VGTTLHYQDLELTVVSVEGPRLHQIQLRRLARNRQDGEAGEAGREL
jgi:hypothetical protein